MRTYLKISATIIFCVNLGSCAATSKDSLGYDGDWFELATINNKRVADFSTASKAINAVNNAAQSIENELDAKEGKKVDSSVNYKIANALISFENGESFKQGDELIYFIEECNSIEKIATKSIPEKIIFPSKAKNIKTAYIGYSYVSNYESSKQDFCWKANIKRDNYTIASLQTKLDFKERNRIADLKLHLD